MNKSRQFSACQTRAAPLRSVHASSQLTTEQARRLKDQVGQRLQFLNRLVERMTKLRFTPTDNLYMAALTAPAALHDLHVKAHHAGCKHGVGKQEEGGWMKALARRA